jgi:hypothetical protein
MFKAIDNKLIMIYYITNRTNTDMQVGKSVSSIPLIGLVKILKRMSYFSDPGDWTILKEIISIFIWLSGMGITVYFAGFLLEAPGPRWAIA